MTEDSTVEFHVRLFGEATDCSLPMKAINIGGGLFRLDAPDLRAAMARGSQLLDLRSKTILLNLRRI